MCNADTIVLFSTNLLNEKAMKCGEVNDHRGDASKRDKILHKVKVVKVLLWKDFNVNFYSAVSSQL